MVKFLMKMRKNFFFNELVNLIYKEKLLKLLKEELLKQ